MDRKELRKYLKLRDGRMPIILAQRGSKLDNEPVIKEGDVIKFDLKDSYRLEVRVVSVARCRICGVVLTDFFPDCCLFGLLQPGETVELDMDYVLARSRNI